jgi:hypothetical protein
MFSEPMGQFARSCVVVGSLHTYLCIFMIFTVSIWNILNISSYLHMKRISISSSIHKTDFLPLEMYAFFMQNSRFLEFQINREYTDVY